MRYGNSPKHVADYMLYLANQARRTLTPMQLLKLVYIAHGWLLGLHGRPLVNEEVEAWPYGPVIPTLYHDFKKYGSRVIEYCPSGKPAGFDSDEERVMREVWDGYGHRTGISLSALTHEPGSPWAQTMERLGQGAVISNDLIEDHYRRLATQHEH